MDDDTVISKLEMLKAEVEWEFALDYQVALERAIEIIREYSWIKQENKLIKY